MTPDRLKEEVLALPPEDRLQLVEDLWDSLAAEPEAIPVPDWHREELDRRDRDPSPEHITPEELHARLPPCTGIIGA
jgi:putative addiction module component (TIGR02574 family)